MIKLEKFLMWAFRMGLFITMALAAAVLQAQTGAYLRTPKAPPQPRINGPKIYGVRPGHPFLYRIPATGVRPMHFSAAKLPSSLHLNAISGIVTGSAPSVPGTYLVTLKAKNAKGSTSRPFKILVGDTIGLTPQLGWNHWYTHLCHVTESDIRTAAENMVSSGMADYGYQYISIDDCWAVKPNSTDSMRGGQARDASGAILSNKLFPEMKKLTDDIHALGLKAGIYSSPGPATCAGYEGSYGHEAQDARQFSMWGFDLLKYDWCSYGRVTGAKTLEDFQKPYRTMGGLLRGLDRDVTLNLCQYGMSDVWKWGKEVGGNSWRTTGDLGLAQDDELPGFYHIAFDNAAHSDYAGPGGWNDPDYLVIGKVAVANRQQTPIHPTDLTPDEQYSYMSMWSLMASPLFFSGDMAGLDEFTLNVLCNSEVIDVDQDVQGKQAHVVRKSAQEYILAKPLEDRSIAVGLFNLTREPRDVSIRWSELGVAKPMKVRDLWLQKNLGSMKDGFSTVVPGHGVMMIRVGEKHL